MTTPLISPFRSRGRLGYLDVTDHGKTKYHLLKIIQRQLINFALSPPEYTLVGAIILSRLAEQGDGLLNKIVQIIASKEWIRIQSFSIVNCLHVWGLRPLISSTWNSSDINEAERKRHENLNRYLMQLTSDKSALLVTLPKEIYKTYKEKGDELISKYFCMLEKHHSYICPLNHCRIENLEDLAIIDTDPTVTYDKSTILAHLTRGGKCPTTQITPKFLYQPFASPPTYINFADDLDSDSFSLDKGYKLMGHFYLNLKRPQKKELGSYSCKPLYAQLCSVCLNITIRAAALIATAMKSSNFILTRLQKIVIANFYGVYLFNFIIFWSNLKVRRIDPFNHRFSFLEHLLCNHAKFTSVLIGKIFCSRSLKEIISSLSPFVIAQVAQIAWTFFHQSTESIARKNWGDELAELDQKRAGILQLPATVGFSDIDAMAWHLHTLLNLTSSEKLIDVDEIERKQRLTCAISYDELENETTAVLNTNLKTVFDGDVIYDYLTQTKRICPTTQLRPSAVLYPLAKPLKVKRLANVSDQIDFSDALEQSRTFLLKSAFEEMKELSQIAPPQLTNQSANLTGFLPWFLGIRA